MVENSLANAGDLRDVGLILGQGDPLGEGTATHSGILVWRIPQTEDTGGLHSIGRMESDMTEVTRHVSTEFSDLKQQALFLFTVSTDQELGGSLAGWFWFKASRSYGYVCGVCSHLEARLD